MVKQKFFIDTVLPGANDVLRIHPQVYSRMKRDYGMLVRVCIRHAKLKRMEWASITFCWHEKPAEKNKRRDPDNVRFAAKFILDSLVAENILEDDSIGFVVNLADRYVIESKTPGVWVELEGKLI